MLGNFSNHRFVVKSNKFFFYIGYILLILYRVIKSSTIGFNDFGLTYVIVSLFFILNILHLNFSKSKLFFISLIGLIVLFCIYKTTDPVLPVVLLGLIASKNIDFKTISKISLYVTFFTVIFVLILVLLGLIPDTQSFRYFGNERVICHGMGFYHSSALPTYFFFIFLNYLYLFPKKRNFLTLFISVLIGFIIFKLCAERLRFYALIIASLFIFILPLISNKILRIKKYIMISVFPLCCISTLLLGYFYNPSNKIMYELNIYLSNRLYFENYSFNNLPITLFGQDILMGEDVTNFSDGTTYFYIDSAYVYLLFEYGIVIYALIIFAYIYGAKKSISLNDDYLCLWFILLAIDSIIGNQILSIWIMPILFIPFCKSVSLSSNS